MYLKRIYLKNFRNYDLLNIEFNKRINIIYGNNAQGKTNLLESIYYLATTKSHRLNNDSEIIKFGSNVCKIKGVINNQKNDTNLEIALSENGKILKINHQEIKKVGNYITSNFNIIIFEPDDLNLIKGSPNERRNFINLELSQISNNYYNILTEYNKILKIRNNVLTKMLNNKNVDDSYFKIITNKLISKAVLIYKMRNKFIDELNLECGDIFLSLTKTAGFTIKYEPNIEFESYETEYLKEKLFKIYQNNYEKEVRLGTTIYGPHRDNIGFYINLKNVKEFGSQGQQRMAILSCKLSEITIYKKYKNSEPIILLDDVFSELDDIKKNNLLKYLKNNHQIIITTTDLKKINKKLLGEANIYKIKEGKIIKLEEMKENE